MKPVFPSFPIPVATGLLLLALAGCAAQQPAFQAYPGARRPDAAQARLLGVTSARGDCQIDTYQVLFRSVDGQSADSYFGGFTNGCRFPSDVLLTPGEHRVGLYYADSPSGSPTFSETCFRADAGRTYRVERRVSGYSVNFAVLDAASGRPATACRAP